jgi:hypothetical protein
VIFFKKKLKPAWTFPEGTSKSERKVWRLLVQSGVLVAELRDTDKKTTEFVGIDLSSGSLLWKNDQLPVPSGEEKWWINLNIIYRDTVLLQQFARPDMPTPGKIFVLDLHTGELLWKNPEVSFLSAAGETIFCSRKTFSSEIMVGFNFRTGIEREISPPEMPEEYSSVQPELTLPEPIDELTEDSRDKIAYRDILNQRIPPDAKQATILKIGQASVIGFYTSSRKDPKGAALYDANLTVTDANGKTIFEDVADKNVYVPLADFYFGIGGKLIYVKNSDEIVAVKLD